MLAVSIASATVVWSIVDRLVLRPVSGVTDPETLYRVTVRDSSVRLGGHERDLFATGEYESLRAEAPSLTAYAPAESVSVVRNRTSLHVLGSEVSSNFFAVVKPLLLRADPVLYNSASDVAVLR